MEEPVSIECPYCGESFTTFVDVSPGDQSYIEDCQVCCRPMSVAVTLRDGIAEVIASAENGG